MPRPTHEILAERAATMAAAAGPTQAYLKHAEAQYELCKEYIEAAVRETFVDIPTQVLPLLATIDGRTDPSEVTKKLSAAFAKVDKIAHIIVEPNTLQIKFYGHPSDT